MEMFPPLDAVPAILSESAQKMIGPLLVWIVPAVVAEVLMPVVVLTSNLPPESVFVRLPLMVTSVP